MSHTTVETPTLRSRVAKADRSRRRYVVNQKVLLITVALLILGTPSVYFWYKHQLSKTSHALLVRAEQLEQEKEWSKATSYYQRYLLLEPEDTEAIVRMVEAYAKGQSTPNRIARLTRMLYQALGHSPERTDLRLLLAENLLKSGNYDAAEDEAKNLIEKGAPETPEANKIVALLMYSRAEVSDSSSVSDAMEALIKAVEGLPGDVRLVTVCSNALRRYPTAVRLEDKDAATYADYLIDQLVEINPDNVDALLARYQYRVQFKLPVNGQDLEAALKISPDHVVANLLSAEVRVKNGESQQAKTLLRHAIETNPYDPRPYVLLAGILKQAGNNREAVDLLQKGYQEIGESLELGLVLVDHLIPANDLQEAARVLNEIQSNSTVQLARLETAARNQVENKIKLLRARLALAQDKPTLAIPELRSILFVADANPSNKKTVEWFQATGMLAQIAEGWGQWDKAAMYWESLAEVVPRDGNIIKSAAAANLKLGDPASAIRRIDAYLLLTEPTEDIMVLLVQSHLLMQLQRPISNRYWSEFERALSNAKANTQNRWELVFAEVEYLLASSSRQSQEIGNSVDSLAVSEKASAILQEAEQAFAEEAAFWQGAARVYQRMGIEKEAERAVSRYQQVESSPINRLTLEASLLSNAGQYEEVDKLIKDLLPSLTKEERQQAQRLRVETLVASKKLESAQELIGTLITNDPEDARLLTLGIGISLDLKDSESAKKWETLLGKQETAESEWRYLHSLRLISSFDSLNSANKEELSSSIARLRVQRPNWYPAIALAARYAQLNGDIVQAMSEYRQAIDLGDSRTSTLEQLVSLLYQHNRLSEAMEYLARIGPEQSDSPMLNTLAFQIAVKQDREGDALKLAKLGVERHPGDTMRHIWHANLLLQNGQAQDAIQVYRQAAKRFPNDMQVWKELLTLFVEMDRNEEARKTILALLADKSLPQEARYFVAAMGYGLLGDAVEAKQYYELILASQPEDNDVRIRYANLLRLDDARAARKQYELVLNQDSNNSVARRSLASLLAATGRDGDWARAQQLLEHQAGDTQASSSDLDRVRAMLLTRQGRNQKERIANCQAACDILEQLIQQRGDESNDINRRLLAEVYEQEAVLGNDKSALYAAREQYRNLVGRENPTPQNLVNYLEFLIRHATFESSTTEADETTAESQTAGSDLREVFLAEAEARLLDLQRVQESHENSLASTFSVVTMTVRLRQAQDRKDEAVEYLSQFIETQNNETLSQEDKSQLYLLAGNLFTYLEHYADAEKWYRQLMEVGPSAYILVARSLVDQGKKEAALELCLKNTADTPTPEEAIVLANIMTTTSEATIENSAVRKAIEAAIATHQENVNLLQAVAVMKASRGEYDEAITTFRRLIEVDSENVSAMNNLATLLAERPNQLVEALEYVERAISLVGRKSGLLDTQGTIFLKAGDFEKAISCLEEATAGGATDARYHFHLAAAYQLANRHDEASSALQSSHEMGLGNTVLTNDDRNLLAQLDQELGQLAPAVAGGKE